MPEEPNIGVEKVNQGTESLPLTLKEFMRRICTGQDGRPIQKVYVYGIKSSKADLMAAVPRATTVVSVHPRPDWISI